MKRRCLRKTPKKSGLDDSKSDWLILYLTHDGPSAGWDAQERPEWGQADDGDPEGWAGA
jgi:hypothetical protein